MAAHFIVTASERQFRVHELVPVPGRAMPSLREVQSLEYLPAKGSYTDRDTDQAGRFPGNGINPGMSIDERLPMQEERHRRIVAWIAARIDEFTAAHVGSPWSFAADPGLHKAVLGRILPASRSSLAESVAKNLIHAPASDLLAHFSGPGSS